LRSLPEILKTYWGYNTFRPLQEEIIKHVLDDKDVLALLPTGGGKSICYQVPALARPGFTLVISPLISLMQDQVARLKELDIPAACVHAGMHYKEVERTLQNMSHGPVKLLYVSPERLQSSLFREYLPEFDINLIAVDEAHCISQWGHDFRPDYLKIGSIRNIFSEIPFLALTATATKEVQEDIVLQLQLRHPIVLKESFGRENIFYSIKYSENKTGDTLDALKQDRATSIIYCRSRKQTETLTKAINGFGIKALAYHAGMAREKRQEAQQAWMNGEVQTMVATTAFGMGIDKGDVRLVIHYDAPEHPEAYYQETGRAGRDGKSANALALYNATDLRRLEDSTAIRFPPEAYLRKVYQSACEYLQIPIGVEPDQYFPFDLSVFCRRFELEALPASYALKLLEQEGLWTITESVFRPSTVHISIDRHALDQLFHAHPEFEMIVTALLRLYGTVFYYPTPIRLSILAKQAKLKIEEVNQLLFRMDAQEILEYQQPKEGPQLFFHHLRVDSQHLLIDTARINHLRQKHIIRTEAMTKLLTGTSKCRQRFVLDYFGENSTDNCGHCDICLSQNAPSLTPDLLRQKLLALLLEQPPMSTDEVLQTFPQHDKDRLLTTLRMLLDENKISRTDDGLFYLKKLQTN
jgi:ATP-dependent DNA helicase RecQ